MPNGGSDCCGTCAFNRVNDEKATAAERAGVPHCTIRHLDVRDPYYTYCANHPHKNPGRLEVPIGPVYVGDSMGNREVWVPLADTPECRRAYLDLLAEIPEQPPESYPAGLSLEQTVVMQLADWKELRALPGLERITTFKDAAPDPAKPFARDQAEFKRLAQIAVAVIRNLPVPEDPTVASGKCLYCDAPVETAPPVRGHLVECGKCHAVIVAGHGRVVGAFGPSDRALFGTPLTMPAEPPACLLPGMEPGKTSGTPASLRCRFCSMQLLDPQPGVVRRIRCPGCDQWLIPAEMGVASGAFGASGEQLKRRTTIVLSVVIVLLIVLIVYMVRIALKG